MTSPVQPASRRATPVAISATIRNVDGVDRVRLNAAYIHAVESVGLVPLIVPPLADTSAAARILGLVGGLLLTGGEDVDPSLYGQPPHEALGPVNFARDTTELALLAAARERGLPTLAICRGIQVANVGLGGTLVQDLPSQRADVAAHERGDERARRVHGVRVEDGTRLASVLGTTSLVVNSVHHQAVDQLADALRASAWADDGVVEGVESTDARWWMVGVQWHPEELTATSEPWDRHLFAAFAQACRSGAEVSSASTSLPAGPAASASPTNGGAGTEARR